MATLRTGRYAQDVRMQLIRLATVTLSRPAPQRLGRWTYTTTSGVAVAVLKPIHGARDVTEEPAHEPEGLTIEWTYDSDESAILVQASTTFVVGPLNGDREVVIPHATVALVDDAIREYADLLSVVHQCQRVIKSPSPCIGVRADDNTERELLDDAVGIAAPAVARPRVSLIPEPRPEAGYHLLIADRLDGVAMLADAMSEGTSSARARELFRFFERAFRRGPADAGSRLAQFMSTGEPTRRLSDEDVSHWFLTLRSRLTHADRQDEYARNRDVDPHLARMEVAAYDVLFNKRKWRDPDVSRRDPGLPLRGAIAPDGAAVVAAGGTNVRGTWLDPYGTFALDFRVTMDLGKEWFDLMPRHRPAEQKAFRQQLPIIVGGERQWAIVDVQMGGAE